MRGAADGQAMRHACNLLTEALSRHPGVTVVAVIELARTRGMPMTNELKRAWADAGLREAVGYLLGVAHATGISPRSACGGGS